MLSSNGGDAKDRPSAYTSSIFSANITYLTFHFASLSHYPSPIQFTPRSFHWLSNVLPHSSEDGQVGGIIVVVTPEMGHLRKTVNIFH